MLISKRRLKWGGLVLLLGLVAVCFRPPRSWIDYALMKQFDDDLQVGQVHYHSRDSVLELRNVNWSKYADGCAFGLSADCAWLAIEAEPLLDRKFIIPRGDIAEANLFLNAASSTAGSSPTVWQEKMSTFLARIDWKGILDRYTLKLDPEGSRLRIRDKLDGWLEDSISNQDQVARISSSLTNQGNPLRVEEDLRVKLSKVDALVSQQRNLLRAVEELSKAEQERLEELKIQLSKHSQEQTRNLILDEDLQPWEKAISEALVAQIATGVWSQWGECGRVAQLLASHMPGWQRASYDQDIAIGAADSRFCSLDDLSVRGQFRSGRREMPFQLLMNGVAYQNETTLSGNWKLRFDAEDAWSVVRLSRTAEDDAAQLEMRVFENTETPDVAGEIDVPIDPTPSPSDRMVDQQGDKPQAERLAAAAAVVVPSWEEPLGTTSAASRSKEMDEAWVDRSDFLLQVTLNQRGQQLQGELELTTRVTSDQLGESGRMFEQALQKSGGKLLSFRVSIGGTWQQPEFSVADGMPSWLTRAIQSQVREHIVNVNSHADADLRTAFDRKVEQHLALVERAAHAAEAVLQQHQHSLLETRSGLQRRIDEVVGVAFTAYREDGIEISSDQR